MSVGHPCIHCREGRVRPFQFSLDQAVLRCDNAGCDSLLEASPWERVISRNIRQQVPRRSSDFGHYRLWGGSSSSSGVQSDIRSPLLSPAQSFGSVTDKEVELLLRKSYAPPKPTRHIRRSPKKCPPVTNTAEVSSTKSQSSMLKTDPKCESFFELLSNLDLESPSHPVKKESPSVSSFDDIVTAELESWMKGFESPESIHSDELSDSLHLSSVGVNPTSAEPNLLKPEETVSELCLPEEQRCIIPSRRSAFSQVSPKREKKLLRPYTCQDVASDIISKPVSAFEENEDIKKMLAESMQENYSNPDSLICTLGNRGDPVKDDLSLLCDSQFLSPAASAASDDSGYNEEDANKVATLTLPHLQENHKLSSYSGSFGSSGDLEVNETAKCKSVVTSSQSELKNLTSADLEVSVPQDIHFNIHPAMVTVEKCVKVNDSPGVESGSLESNEDVGTLPANQSTSNGEFPLTTDNEREVEASNAEEEIVENTPSFSRSCSVDRESNGSHSVSGDESILRTDSGATSIINSSQTSMIDEHCEDIVSVASSHSGSTFPSDIVEDDESKALCSDQSSDGLSLCSGASINQCKGSNRGRGRGRGRGKRRGRGKTHATSGCGAGNVKSSDSNLEVSNDAQPRVRGRGRGRGRGRSRGKGQGSVDILPGSSELQPSKRPRVAAEMLHRQTRQRTGSIEVQASTVPRERLSECSVDSSDGNMRRGLSSLLQGPSWHIAEQKNIQHNQNFTNLSFRNLLSGSVARDPWSVMELFLEELDIEVVVQGIRSSPEVPSEGTSSPGTSRTTDEASNNILQQKHGEELEGRTNEVKNKELQIERSGLGTPVLNDNSVFHVQDHAQGDVLSEKEKMESEINFENSLAKADQKDRNEAYNIHTTQTTTSKNIKHGVVSEESVFLLNDNKDGMQVVKKLCNIDSSITSSLPSDRQDYEKMGSTIPVEIAGDSQVLEFAQELQQGQTEENPQDSKAYISKPKGESPEDLEINEEPHAVQTHFQPHCTHNSEVTVKEERCVLPEENVHSNLEVTVSDRQGGMKMDSQPLQVDHIPCKVSTHLQEFGENQEHIGIVNELSKVTVDQDVNSSVVSDENLRETKQHCFTFKESEQCKSLPVEKQIIDKKSSQTQQNTPKYARDIRGEYTKETTLDLSDSSHLLGTPNGSRAIQNPKHNEELEVKNTAENSMNLMQHDTDTMKIPQFPIAVQDLPINYECSKSKDTGHSHQEVHVIDILKNFIQECNGSVARSGSNEGQCIKSRKKEVEDSNSVSGCNSSLFQNISTTTDSEVFQNISTTTDSELKKCNTPPSESSPNASPYYLLHSPDSKNVRSWMGSHEDSSLKEEAQTMPHMENKDMHHTALLKNNNSEATVKGSSSKYFGSLLQDIDFDDKFFQCPVQEHPSKTFDEHISSSLFFGETASSSPPQTVNPESPKRVKSEENQDLVAKYRDAGYLEQDENCKGNNIQASQYPVCKVSEHCAVINSISTTSTQMHSVPSPANVAAAPFPMRLSEPCTWMPSCPSLSHLKAEASCDDEATNLPVAQTFTSSAVYTAPKTPRPTLSYSSIHTTCWVPMVTTTTMTTVPSVMIDSIPSCSSIPITKTDTLDRKSKRKKKHISRKLRMNAVRKEKIRNEESQILTADTSISKRHCKERNETYDSTCITQDCSGTTYTATAGSFRNNLNTSDQSGCDTKQGESSINLPSASVFSVVQSIDDRVVSVKMEEALHDVSGISEVTEKGEKYTVRQARIVPSGSVCVQQEPKCFQSRNDCSDEYDESKPASSQLQAVDSMSVCAGEVNFIINTEKPGTSRDGDGDDDIPVISIDSEDEIQIIIPEKKGKHLKKTKDDHDATRKILAEDGCVSDSANGCTMQEEKKNRSNLLEGNPEFLHKIKREEGIIGEIFGWDGELKVEYIFPEEQMCRSNQRGQKRMVEDVDGSQVIKKQRSISDAIEKEKTGRLTKEIDSSSDGSCSERGALICGILDNSVIHDKKCFSPRVKEFVDFDENARVSNDAQENNKFYSVSKQSGKKLHHDVNAFGQIEFGVSREGEHSYILKQDKTLQRESSCHVFDTAKFCQDYKFGCTKSSPQHEINPALKSDESNPGLLELDSTETGFLSMLITSPESCIASPEPSQRELGSDGCNCHTSVKSMEAIGSGHETSGIESRLTDGTEVGASDSESEETIQPTSDFETETSVYDGSEEESESECEDSWESPGAQKPMLLSNMNIQITDSEGTVLKVIPVVDSNYANNVEQLKSVKTSHSLKPEHSQDTLRPEKTSSTSMLSSRYVTSQPPLVHVMPVTTNMTNSLEPICLDTTSPSPSSSSHIQFLERKEEKILRNPQTHFIQPQPAFSQGSTAEHQGQRPPVLPIVPQVEPIGVQLSRSLSSQSWGVPLETTSVNRITNSTNIMQTHPHYFSQYEKQESVIDYKIPVSPKPLTIVPPALVTSYANIMPANMVLTQANTTTCLREDSESSCADKPQERIVAITSQTANGPVTRVLRVVTPSVEHSDHPKDQHCRKNSTNKKNSPVDSLSERIDESCLENNMLKKVKMGSKGGFYMRPTSTLMNAISEMRRKSELDAKVKEDAEESSKYVELPDGEPISHPLVLPSDRKGKTKLIKSKKRRKKIREKIRRERKTRKFVKEKVEETVERSKDNCVVPEMVVVCVGGNLHVYRREIAKTSTQ